MSYLSLFIHTHTHTKRERNETGSPRHMKSREFWSQILTQFLPL